MGPYDLQRKQASSASTGLQSYSTFIDDANINDTFHGVVTALSAGGNSESGYSNADATTVLPPQSALTPAHASTVPNGRPTLVWSQNQEADGYLYFVYDKNPWDANPQLLWVNPVENGKRRATADLSASYPASKAALPSGTYFWWVAGVSFDVMGKPDGFSFSEVA